MKSHNLSPEEQFILLTARLQPSEDALREAQQLVSDRTHPLDYEKLFQLSVEHSVAPCIFKNSHKISGLPASFVSLLENAYYVIAKNNILHLQETIRISGELAKEGIEAIVLKGSFASATVIGDLGLYPTGDIDLLIKTEDFGKTAESLINGGYTQKLPTSNDNLSGQDYAIFENKKYTVDVHWNLSVNPISAFQTISGGRIQGRPCLMMLNSQPFLLTNISFS